MNVYHWLVSCFSRRGKAITLYRRGMAKAKKHDHQGALDDYTTLIGMPGMSADLMAMGLYNRALIYVAAGDERKGTADLDAVLTMNDALVRVKTMARQKLARMRSRTISNL